MRFTCATCGKVHEGLPDLSFDAPPYFTRLDENERASRATLSSDFCAIDDTNFFVRGVLEIPLKETGEVFGWGAWVTLSKAHFDRYAELFEVDPPPGEGPWFGWFSNRLPGYPDTVNLKTRVHLQPQRQRPRLELEPAAHQREGIALADLLAIIADRLHDGEAGSGHP